MQEMIHWKLKPFMEKHGISAYKLANAAGTRLSNNAVYNMVKEDYQYINFKTLNTLLKVLSEIVGRTVRMEEIVWHEPELERAA